MPLFSEIIVIFVISLCLMCFMCLFPQDNHGIIERDDLKRFSFSFSVFMGKIKNLVPGVKVHFTVFKNKVSPVSIQLFCFVLFFITGR